MAGGFVRRNLKMYPVCGYLLAMLGLFGLAGCTGEQDQTVPDLAIAYVKRPIPEQLNLISNELEPANPDVRHPSAFNEGGDPDFFNGGGDVYLRSSASPSASEQNITACVTGGRGDIKDLDASFEGDKLIFSLRMEDLDPNDDVVPTWNIYEYDVASGGCPTLVMESGGLAEEGDDVAPAYLPDGRIVFSSTRQHEVGAIQLNEGKPQFLPVDEDRDRNPIQHAMNLHVMSISGTRASIKQLTFNQSHDLDPSVMANGEILFSRWDHMGGRNAISLYKIRPDGTELKAVYGLHDHAVGTGGSTVQFLSPRELENGQILGMIKPFTGSRGGGAPVVINAIQFADKTQPTWPYENAVSGTGQVNAVTLGVTTDGSISPAGRFRSVYPLWDGSNRALVSWTQCRLEEADGDLIPCPSTIPANATEAYPLYGIYIYDLGSNTQLPVVIPVEGLIIDEPVVLASRARPSILFDKGTGFGLDQALYDDNVGLLHIRSVYDMDGSFNDLVVNGNPAVANLAAMADPTVTGADVRSARFLRLIKGAYFPDNDTYTFTNRRNAFGVSTQQGMREILGYATVEPDGSVLVKVPANVPFAISVVDEQGRRVVGTNGFGIAERHQNWLQVRPGEVLECNGCHDHTPPGTPAPDPRPHGYRDAPDALNVGAATTGIPFDGTTTDIDPDPMVVEEINPNMGETMAEARFRTTCGPDAAGALGIDMGSTTCPSDLVPNINPDFTDVWASGAIPDVVNLRYTDLNTQMPANATSVFCQPATWEANCRIIINYQDHIHTLWSLPRQNTLMNDATCTNSACHNSLNNTRVPEADLDLSDDVAPVPGNLYRSYRELLINDVERDASGAPIEVLVFDANGDPVYVVELDANGDPVLDANGDQALLTDANGDFIQETVQIPVLSSMSNAGARSSNVFFNRFFVGSGNAVHEGALTPSEIRLLAEWLDIGAQYFNNPFDAPEN